MADEATLDTLAANQQTIITALGALTTIGTKLDTLNTSLGTVNTSVGKVETAVGALKTELTAQMEATNQNMSYIGSGAAVDTNVDTDRVFVVSPWPPKAASDEDESEETPGDDTPGGN